jgi:hypothetical protein
MREMIDLKEIEINAVNKGFLRLMFRREDGRRAIVRVEGDPRTTVFGITLGNPDSDDSTLNWSDNPTEQIWD